MLVEKLFNQADAEIIEKKQKKFRKVVNIVLPVLLVFEILVIYLVSLWAPSIFWPLVITSLIFLLLFHFTFLKLLKKLKKDLAEQIKLKGELRVTSKTRYKGVTFIHFDSGDLKAIPIAKKSYDKIKVDDILQIEIAKYSRNFLHLSRSGQNLMEGN